MTELSYKLHLLTDEKLASIVVKQGAISLKRKKNIYIRLCAAIMGQQLSVKVAELIYKRFLDLYGGREPTVMQLLETPFDTLRSIGLSNAKTTYILNVANYALQYDMSDKKLYKMSDNEVMDFLLPIKGVGTWTIEMLLMFALAREDVFACDDLGIQQAMVKIYDLDTADKKKMRTEMLQIAEQWAPYRTYACMYLWRYKDAP